MQVTVDITARVMVNIREIPEKRLLVGIPAEENARGEEIGNAALGFIHENGSPACVMSLPELAELVECGVDRLDPACRVVPLHMAEGVGKHIGDEGGDGKGGSVAGQHA